MKRLIGILLVLALVLGAGGIVVWSLIGADGGEGPGDGPGPTVSAAPEAGSDEPPDAGLAAYYEQEPEWTECRSSFWCATVTVPLDYAEPGGEAIEIALLKRAASDPGSRVGSLVVNPGGPGAPGTDYAAQASLVFREPLLQRFDIVGFDPRGTGDSAPVDCLSDAELDTYIASDPSPDDADEREAALEQLELFGEGCVERSGDLASHITTIEAARDMDVIRAVLGEAELDYFGASYGTKLGATYADLFPDRVGRLVLDGAVDLGLSPRELALEQAAGFETALRAYVQDCLDTGDGCFLGDSMDEALATIQQLIADVDEQPLPTRDGSRDLEVGNAFYGIVAPLYVRDYWFLLSAALSTALDGDGTALLELSDLYTSRGSDGGYTDNSSEAIYAISCLDDPTAVEPSRVASEIPDFEQASPTFGEVFAWGLTGCLGSVARSSEEPREVRAAGAPPILVVGTTRDPATPYQWAEALADQLESGVLLSRDGDGHTAYNSGNACIDETIEAYLIDGAVPADGQTC